MQKTKIKTKLSVSIPSFLKGTARVFDLYGNLDQYNFNEKLDHQCINEDWENIGIKF